MHAQRLVPMLGGIDTECSRDAAGAGTVSGASFFKKSRHFATPEAVGGGTIDQDDGATELPHLQIFNAAAIPECSHCATPPDAATERRRQATQRRPAAGAVRVALSVACLINSSELREAYRGTQYAVLADYGARRESTV